MNLFNETTKKFLGEYTTSWEITREDGMMVAWLVKGRKPFAKWIVSKKGVYETFASKADALSFAATIPSFQS